MTVAGLIAKEAIMEMANGFSAGEDNISQPGLTPASQDASAPVEKSTVNERTFTQSDVNEIVKKVRNQETEKARRLPVEQPEYAQKKYGDMSGNNLGNYPDQKNSSPLSVDESHYRRIAAEEAQRLRNEWVSEAQNKAQEEYAQKIVQNFWNKITPGKEKYSDFDQITGNIELGKFPNTVQLLAEYIDNSGDVLYELGKDRLKLAQLEQLAQFSPNDAIIQAQRLSKSIRENEEATKSRLPNEPLSQMRPSNSGAESGGVLSVKDYRKKYRG